MQQDGRGESLLPANGWHCLFVTGKCRISRVDRPDYEISCQLVSRKDKSAVYSFNLGQDELDSESRISVNVEIEVAIDGVTQWLSIGELSLSK
jgi:hypothetical protein